MIPPPPLLAVAAWKSGGGWKCRHRRGRQNPQVLRLGLLTGRMQQWGFERASSLRCVRLWPPSWTRPSSTGRVSAAYEGYVVHTPLSGVFTHQFVVLFVLYALYGPSPSATREG